MFPYDCYTSLPIQTIQEQSATSSTIMGLYFSRDTGRQHLLFFIGKAALSAQPAQLLAARD